MNISSISMFNVKPMNFSARESKNAPVCPRATEDMCDHYERLCNGKSRPKTTPSDIRYHIIKQASVKNIEGTSSQKLQASET